MIKSYYNLRQDLSQESGLTVVAIQLNYCNFEIKLTLVLLFVVHGARLESVYTVKGIVGSNPTLFTIAN